MARAQKPPPPDLEELSEKVQSADANVVTERQLRSMLDVIPARIWFIDRDFRIRFANRECTALFGPTLEEMIGLHASAYFSGETFKEEEPHFRRALAGETVRREGWVTYPDGERHYTQRIYSPHRNRHGEIDGYYEFVRDITELKRVEAELRDSEARFRSIASAHPVPVAIAEAFLGGKILYVSEPWCELYGISAEEAVGLAADSFYADSRDRRRFLDMLRDHGSVRGFELRMERADGSSFWGTVTAKRIRFEDREAVIVGLFDLTDRRAAEAEIERQRDALHQGEKMSALGSLLAGVAHELNNPLSVVIGQSMMMLDDATEASQQARAQKIRDAAERCGRIVKTFLDMARERDPVRQPLDVNDVVESALELFGYGLRGSTVELVRDLAPALPHVVADADQLHQVITNLCLNARQALDGQSGAQQIHVSTGSTEDNSGVIISVADNGPGIPQKIRSRIFEPFFTSKPTGTGIGLSVCHGLVEGHGGTLEIADTLGGGATFLVRLPLSGTSKENAASGDSTDRA